MISPAYVVTMATYNSEMNRRLYAAASRLSEAERRADRRAFWRSIHGTLSHLLWGDQMWMSRFAGWPKPSVVQADSATMFESWDELVATRVRADLDIEAWTAQLDAAWLADDLTWFSGSAGREMRRPRGLLVTHFFNHQTHHRGQVHAMLTAAGQRTGDTDLPQIVAGG